MARYVAVPNLDDCVYVVTFVFVNGGECIYIGTFKSEKQMFANIYSRFDKQWGRLEKGIDKPFYKEYTFINYNTTTGKFIVQIAEPSDTLDRPKCKFVENIW